VTDPDDLAAATPGPSGGRVFGDAAALFALAALPGPYLPWGSGAMRPAGLVTVCNDVVLNDRRRIVELGSGSSTIMLARLLAQLPEPETRRLIAVEHDPTWSRWVTERLRAEGIGEHVVVVDAPLQEPGDGGGGLAWYDGSAVGAAIDVIDLLVVDGPPAYDTGLGLARLQALPALRERLAPGATVVLDDIERPGEQAVLRRWTADFGLSFRVDTDAGVAVATVP
jgi:predicted O-methyltransferase YrrM